MTRHSDTPIAEADTTIAAFAWRTLFCRKCKLDYQICIHKGTGTIQNGDWFDGFCSKRCLYEYALEVMAK
ncbi:hypothetical protein L0244_39760 [bacterium]|nr:hypothetical protein [bacterium]